MAVAECRQASYCSCTWHPPVLSDQAVSTAATSNGVQHYGQLAFLLACLMCLPVQAAGWDQTLGQAAGTA